VSSPYGYGQGQPPGVLPPPQATPWPQQQYQQPGQWAQPYGGRGGQQFGGGFQPRRRGSSGCLKVLVFGFAAIALVLVGIIVLAATLVGKATNTAGPGGQPEVTGPSIVPTASTQPEKGSAEDVLLNDSIYGVGGMGELNCPAENLGDGSVAAQKRYYTKLFKCLNDGWRPLLEKTGAKEPDPGLVVFDKPVTTPCGNFKPKSGRVLAFYCYGNSVMYTDVLQMNEAFGPKEDLAYLMVIAHEYGHHVQGVSGLFRARMLYLQDHPSEELPSSRRNELQASCFAGVFSRAVEKSYPFTKRLQEFEWQSGHSFGDPDDIPQDKRTHGKAKSQGFWIMNGLNIGETKACNTFAAPDKLLQ
jgi:predicted metalloprotease